jgi:ABC-type antimicrobial peptide transport system permease subunit
MALGATPGALRRGLALYGLKLTAAGLLLGALGGYALSRLLQGLVYGVSTGDPITFSVSGLVLLGAATLASYLPARRATRIDPMVALREE